MNHQIGRLHLLTDTQLQNRFSHLELVQFALEAGVPTIQYREKRFQKNLHLDELREIRKLTRGKAQLVVNDHVWLAVEVEADGVHVGQEDMAPEQALSIIAKDQRLGVTIHTMEELEAILHLPVAYIGVGPVFSTLSKQVPYPPLGLKGIEPFCVRSPFPVIAIGGIQVHHIQPLFEHGVYGVAVLSAFCCSPTPWKVAKELVEAVERVAP
jgi:thiamine-phosphate diphosphorylase